MYIYFDIFIFTELSSRFAGLVQQGLIRHWGLSS